MRIMRYLAQEGDVRYAVEQADGRCLELDGDLFSNFQASTREARMVKLLAPVAARTILAIGLNYTKHAAESGSKLPERPMLFIKSQNALHNPGDPIEIPRYLRSEEVDYEAELAVVIGRDCKNVPEEKALDYVLGYTAANDVSARDWQRRLGGGQFCRGKSFDTFAPLGPVLVTKDEIPDPQALKLMCRVNGEARQNSSTADMIFNVATLVSFLSGSTTLYAGTVILTGTPEGVGMGMKPPRYLQAGDVVEVEIEKIGVLSNPVIEEPAES
ncbi:MAG: fumarylacetoacetate hydrolase family protein [Verrucomicrobia bacterium]|nr:fumarylacetoacetate hydrolase family protein [Verrucomicrobiota bacterium]